MSISESHLRACLQLAFPEATIVLNDLAGDEDHWQAEIISPRFAGLSRIAQHRLVQQAVKDETIHALSIITRAE